MLWKCKNWHELRIFEYEKIFNAKLKTHCQLDFRKINEFILLVYMSDYLA